MDVAIIVVLAALAGVGIWITSRKRAARKSGRGGRTHRDIN